MGLRSSLLSRDAVALFRVFDKDSTMRFFLRVARLAFGDGDGGSEV